MQTHVDANGEGVSKGTRKMICWNFYPLALNSELLYINDEDKISFG